MCERQKETLDNAIATNLILAYLQPSAVALAVS